MVKTEIKIKCSLSQDPKNHCLLTEMLFNYKKWFGSLKSLNLSPMTLYYNKTYLNPAET